MQNKTKRAARPTDGKEAQYGSLSAEALEAVLSVQEKARKELVHLQKDLKWPWERIAIELYPVITSKSQLSRIKNGEKDISLELYVAVLKHFHVDLLKDVDGIGHHMLSPKAISLLAEFSEEVGCKDWNFLL